MNRRLPRSALALLLAVAAPAVAVEPSDAPPAYVVDPARSELVVRTFKDGLAARLAHDHAIKARDVTGELVFDPERPEASRVKVTVRADTLIVDELKVRKRYGLEGAVPDGDREQIRKAMLSKEQLWADKHKTIEFSSTRFRPNPDGTFTVAGDFTLRGVTRPVTMTVVLEPIEGGALRGVGKVRLKQSDFGYAPYEAMLGAVKNKDELVLHVNLVARKAR